MDLVTELQVAWTCLVRYRNIALEKADFDRAVGYTAVIDDLAMMIAHAGGEIPDILEA